jgi:hypothetical protein
MAQQVYTRDNTNYGLNSIVSAIQNNIDTRNARLDKTFGSVKDHALNMINHADELWNKHKRKKEFDDSDLREQLLGLRSNRDETARQLSELKQKMIFDKNKAAAFEKNPLETDGYRTDGTIYDFIGGNDALYV